MRAPITILVCLLLCSSTLVFGQTYWTGATSTAWNVASNWSNGVPTSAVDAVIGDSHFTGSFQPTTNVNRLVCRSLTVGGTVAATLTILNRLYCSGSITINPNGTIDHTGAVDLRLTGNWNNSGTYNGTVANAQVYFNGTGTQNLIGVTTFRRLYVASGTTVIQNAITVNTRFYMNGGTTRLQSPITVNTLFQVNGGTFDPQTYLVTLPSTVTFSGGTVRVRTATFAENYSVNPTTIGTGNTIEFSGTINQTIPVFSGVNYSRITIIGSGTTKYLSDNITLQSSTTTAGRITITSGTLDLQTFTANRGTTTTGGTLSIASVGILRIGGTGTFPANYNTVTLSTGSTVEYYGNSPQNVTGRTYSNLIINKSGAIATLAGNTTSSGTLTVTSGSTLNISNRTLTVSGNLDVDGTISGTGAIAFSGTNKTLDGTGSITNTGTFTVSGGNKTILSSANLTIAGTIAISGSRRITNNGTITTTATGGITGTVTGSTWVNAANSTLNISGPLLTTGTLTATANNNTINYTGTTVSQRIKGTTYYNLTIDKGGLTDTLGGNTTVSHTLTIASGNLNCSTYTLSAAGNINNAGTLTSTGLVQATGNSSIISGTGTYHFNNLTVSGSGVSFNPSTSVTIDSNLTVSGAGFTIPTSTTVTVGGNISTTGSGTLTENAGTISMTGTSRTINGNGILLNNFEIASGASVSTSSNLTIAGSFTATGSFTAGPGTTTTLSGSSNTISGSGSLTFDALNVTGNISTARNITINSDLSINGSLTATSGTITFNGASALSGTANLYNVSIQAGDTLQLGTGATLGIAGAFTQNGILDVTTTIPNTINYNSGSQTVTATTYDNLTLSNGGTKTAANSLTIDGDLTIASGTTFDAGPYSHTIYGNIINNGTFTASTSNVQMLGSNDASISGATTFNTLTINKTSSDNVVTLQSDVTADTLNMISGQLNTGSHTITITSTRIGTGTIIGTIKWQPVGGFTNGTAYPFEGTNTITFASGGGNVSSITITVKLGPVADFPFGSSINREYDIVANGTDYDATLRLHYENSELNGNNETLLDTWHYNGNWTANGQSGRDTSVNYVDRDSLTDLNGRWTLAEIVSVLRWTGAVSPDWENVGNWSTVQNSSGGPPGTRDVVNIGDTVFTNQPTINSDVNIRGIAFSSTTATNLTISSGSLSTFGNISGTWSSSQSHSITISTHNLTIGGSLVLSDGTTGHNIDLTTSGSVSIVGSLTQTGDASVSIVSGMLEIGGDYNTNGSFSAGSGTVMYNGSSSQIVAPLSYYNLAFNKSSGTATLSSTAIVNGKMTLATGGTFLVNGSSTILTIADSLRISTGATLNGGSSAIKVAGHWSNSGTFTPASGTIELYGGNAQNVNTSTFNNFVINKSTGTTVTLIGNITVNGNLTDSSGTLDLSTFTANRTVVGGTLRLAGGTTLKIGNTNNFPANFSANSLSTTSTVEYIINGSQTIAPITYGNLTLSSGGSKNLNGSTTVAGNLTIDNGITLNAGVSSLTLQGNWINNGIFTSSSNLVQLSGSSKAISGNSITFHSLSVLGSYSTSTNITVDSNAIISGSITADPATTLTFVGDISNSGTLTTSGIVTFNGTQVQNIALNSGFSSTGTTNFNGTIAPVFSGISSPQFSILNINNTDTAGISPSIGWNVNGTFTVASGVKFYGGVATHTFNSTFTNNGTVTSDGGTLIFSPSTATTITLGSSFSSTGVVEFGGSGLLTIVGSTPTINTLTISNTNSAGVTLPAGWTIIADLIIETNAKLNGGSSSYSIGGSWINYGTFDGQASTVTMTDTSVITGTGTTFNNIIIASGAAVTAISGFNIAGNLTVNGIFDGTGQNIIFSGNTSSTIAGTSTITLDIVSIAKTSATTTLNQSLNGISLLNVIGGTLDIITYSVSEVAGTGTLQIDADATLKISGANNFPSFTTYDFDPASNVEYNSSGAQTISITPEYGNLVLSNGGNKSAALPGLTINGNFTLNGGNFTPSNNTSHQVEGNLNIAGGTFTGANNTYISIGGDFIMSGGTFAPGNNTDTISGNWTMSGGSFTTGSSTIIFNGSSDQTISSTGAFNNLNISKTSGALTLGIDATINGTLTFTDGKITTGSNKVIIGTSGNVTGANANRYVVGNLQKNVATGAPVTRVFEIGDASTYARDSIVFASVTTAGNLTASTTAGDHPNIITDSVNAVKSVNRYWTLTNSGIVFTTYSATFNFPSGDIDPGATTGNFIVSRYNGSSWSYPNIGTKTSNSTQGIAINSLSDFQIGEPFSGLNYTWDGGGDKRSWGDANNWNPNTIPSSGDNVNLIGPDTIDINIAASCLTISINNSQFRINILSGGDLAAAGNLIMAGGVFNTEASFPTVSGSVSLTGGTFGYTASSGTQTIAGQTYNNLVLSGGGTKTASGNITINSDLTISAGTLALGTYTANRATSGGTLTLASGTTLKVGGTTGGISGSNFPTNFSTVTLNGTVEFSGSGAQVSVLNYTNLALSGSGTKSLAGNISISGDLNITAGTLNLNNNTLNRTVAGGNLIVSSSATLAVGGSSGGLPGSNFPANFTSLTLDGLINFNGTSAQTIPAINYNNLTVSNTGSVTLANSGTIGIAGVFTPGTATYTITGSTISYNGTTAQNIVTFNYNNLTISNTGSVTLASSGTIGIASVFTPDTATYTITGSTFDYNGSSSQTITAFDYNNLVISGSGSKTLANNITVAGDLTITSGSLNLSSYTANRTTPGSGTLSVSSGATLLVGGSSGGKSTSNFPNNYSNNTLSGTVEFNGSSPQTIPELTYSNMIFSNPVSITIDTSITATGSVLANLGSSWIVPSGVIFTINGNLRNRGSVTNDGTVNIGP